MCVPVGPNRFPSLNFKNSRSGIVCSISKLTVKWFRTVVNQWSPAFPSPWSGLDSRRMDYSGRFSSFVGWIKTDWLNVPRLCRNAWLILLVHNRQPFWAAICAIMRRETGITVVELCTITSFSVSLCPPVTKRALYVGFSVSEFLWCARSEIVGCFRHETSVRPLITVYVPRSWRWESSLWRVASNSAEFWLGSWIGSVSVR